MSIHSDVIIERVSVGRALKIIAICTKTGDEVSIVGDPKAPPEQLTALAVRKLRYVQAKKQR